MDANVDELKCFLMKAGVHINTISTMLEEGMTLEVLLQANESELAILAPKVVDRIKLRSALDKLRINSISLQTEDQIWSSSASERHSVTVALPVRQEACIFQPLLEEELLDLPSTSTAIFEQKTKVPKSPNRDDSFSLSQVELERSDEKQEGKNLRCILSSETTGKALLEKCEKGDNLNARDRAHIVKVIVETELNCLEKLNNTIRKDVWQQWAKEITHLFKAESKNVYYVPYHIVGGKVIQASGLIHNRLITHRRSLAPESRKRQGSSNSSSESDSSIKTSIKRVRPLPDGFKIDSSNNIDESSSREEQLEWLRGSSSPPDTVIAKWKATFDLRTKLLESHSFIDYFSVFPALQLPSGYKLLSSDFETVYPGANDAFVERFPIIKLKILKFLADKTESLRVDQPTLDLLELASVGEEQANVAAFLGIINLLRQMPTICMPRKKVWKLSREEVRSGFIGRVSTASDIERYCCDRETLVAVKGIPSQPYILAVGSSWANVTQYEIVIHKGLRYQLPDIRSAIMSTFNIYWALDCAYPKDSAPCWMFIQRAMFQMTSKYDTEGVPLRELLLKINM